MKKDSLKKIKNKAMKKIYLDLLEKCTIGTCFGTGKYYWIIDSQLHKICEAHKSLLDDVKIKHIENEKYEREVLESVEKEEPTE